MEALIGRSWSMWLWRGIVALIFGLVAMFSPFTTLATLVMLAAAFIIVDGIFSFFSLFSRRGSPFWSSLMEGAIGVGFGLALLFWPGIALMTFIYMVAAWAIFTGVFEIMTAIRLRKVIEREWALGMAGLASIAFGVAALVFPGLGLMAISWMLGGYAIIFGVLMINISMNVRRDQHKIGGMGTPKPV